MNTKPEKIIKRITKAVSQRQSVLLIGEWDEKLIKGIKENQNSITQSTNNNEISNLPDNSFTRIIMDYSRDVSCNVSTIQDTISFYKEVRRLLLPTGIIIISANCELNFFERLFKKEQPNTPKIKPKVLQDQIHDNGFLIDGYYGYPSGHLLMMAQIINKEVSTLFSSEEQETISL